MIEPSTFLTTTKPLITVESVRLPPSILATTFSIILVDKIVQLLHTIQIQLASIVFQTAIFAQIQQIVINVTLTIYYLLTQKAVFLLAHMDNLLSQENATLAMYRTAKLVVVIQLLVIIAMVLKYCIKTLALISVPEELSN